MMQGLAPGYEVRRLPDGDYGILWLSSPARLLKDETGEPLEYPTRKAAQAAIREIGLTGVPITRQEIISRKYGRRKRNIQPFKTREL